MSQCSGGYVDEVEPELELGAGVPAEAPALVRIGRTMRASPFEETRSTLSPWLMVAFFGSWVLEVMAAVTGALLSRGSTVIEVADTEVAVPR